MDIKIAGITEEIMRVALDQAKDGRVHILGEMAKALTAPRAELGEHAPRIETMQIPTDKIREVIGSGGKVIREIVEKTGAKINIEDDGTVKIASADAQVDQGGLQLDPLDRRRARGRRRSTRARSSRRWSSAPSSTSSARATASSTSPSSRQRRVSKVTDVVKEGDKVKVKFLGMDERGKVRLSMKVVDQETGEDLDREAQGRARGGAQPRAPERAGRGVIIRRRYRRA